MVVAAFVVGLFGSLSAGAISCDRAANEVAYNQTQIVAPYNTLWKKMRAKMREFLISVRLVTL